MKIPSILSITVLLFTFSLSIGPMFAQTLNDAQIAQIVITANQVDIDAGQIADARAKSPDVKAYGAMMVRDHNSVNTQATDLAAKLKLTPEENSASQSLKMGG